jgi:hypothetical protein
MAEIRYSESNGGQLIVETDSGRFYLDPRSATPAKVLRDLTMLILRETQRRVEPADRGPNLDRLLQEIRGNSSLAPTRYMANGMKELNLEDLDL